jgi:predicted nucleotidyltransferase
MANLNAPLQSLVNELHNYLQALYGARLCQVMLFGSHARGEARKDSDVDILVVLAGEVNAGLEVTKVSQYLADLSLRYDTVVNCFFMDETRFNHRQGPLLRNIRREGIPITDQKSALQSQDAFFYVNT